LGIKHWAICITALRRKVLIIKLLNFLCTLHSLIVIGKIKSSLKDCKPSKTDPYLQLNMSLDCFCPKTLHLKAVKNIIILVKKLLKFVIMCYFHTLLLQTIVLKTAK